MVKNPRWEWWKKALDAGKNLPKILGTPELPNHADEYHIGYFRMQDKSNGGQWVAVGIYPVNGVDVGMVNDKETSRDLVELFQWCCRYPVTYAAYSAAIKGGGWSDEPELYKVGDNSQNMSEFERLTQEYLGEKEMCEEFLKTPITTQEQADKVAIWKNRLTKIKGKAEGLHKVEKQPHLDAGRAVDDKWRDLKEEPDKLNKRLLAHIKPFLDKKQREADEKARKAREEAERIAREKADAERRARAEQDRIAAQAASEAERELASRQAHERAEQEKADLEAQEAAVKDEAKGEKVSAGRTGARVSSRKRRYGKVNDYKAAAIALVELGNSELIELIDKIANRAATDEMPFDGMTIETETVYV